MGCVGNVSDWSSVNQSCSISAVQVASLCTSSTQKPVSDTPFGADVYKHEPVSDNLDWIWSRESAQWRNFWQPKVRNLGQLETTLECMAWNSNIERIRHSDACEPWGYVTPVVAAVVTRAPSVRHIYLISMHKFVIFVPHVFKDGWLLKVEVGNSYILLECIICHYVIAPLERKNTADPW